ncbi:MAG: hypothetical protein QXP02_00880 [Desulfurococcaceae archaeon]
MQIQLQMHVLLPHMSWFSALSLVLFGIVMIFAGRFIAKILVSFATGMIAGLIAFEIANILGIGRIGSLLSFLVFFLIFALIGWLFFKLAIALVFATNMWLLLQPLLGYQDISHPISIIMLMLLLILGYIASEVLIGLTVIVVGALSLFTGLLVLTGPLISLIVTLAVLILRAYIKWR